MGSGSSCQETIESRWWEEKALDILTNTSDIGKVGLICSFIPVRNESAMIGVLKERSDLETLLTIHYKSRELSKEQSVTSLILTDETFATYMHWGCTVWPKWLDRSSWLLIHKAKDSYYMVSKI